MRELNRKVLGIAVALLFAIMLVAPVYADPTQGQKASITLTWTETSTVYAGEPKIVGNVIQFHMYVTWDVELAIDGGPTLYGTAFTDRDMLVVLQKDGGRLVVVDYYELSFPDEEGGFEGNALVMMTGYIPIEPPIWEKSRGHGLLHGTGAFEGQTINGGGHWHLFDPEHAWTGYLLKP